MNKLSEARLRVLIQEELESAELESVNLEQEKKEKLEKNISVIKGQIEDLTQIYDNPNLEEDVNLAGLSNLAFSGAGDLIKSISGESDTLVGTAIEQFAKDLFANFVLEKLGLPAGKPRDLLKSFIEELTLEELYDFMRDPSCEKFVDHSMDALIDFFADWMRVPLQAFSDKLTSVPGGRVAKAVLGKNNGTDMVSKLFSGTATEALGEWIKSSAWAQNHIENTIVPNACEVWENVWENFDLEDASMSLSKALYDAYPEGHALVSKT
jgi:hypothetical protein